MWVKNVSETFSQICVNFFFTDFKKFPWWFFFMFGHLSLVTTAAQAACVAVPVPVPVHQNLYRFYCIFNLFQVT